MDEFAEEMLIVIAKYHPFTLPELKIIYDEVEDFQYLIDLCQYAIAQGFSDLRKAENDKYKNVNEQFEGGWLDKPKGKPGYMGDYSNNPHGPFDV